MDDNRQDLDFTISVDRMRVHARHGVFEQERTVGNEFEVSVTITVAVGAGSYADDNLDSTVSYADVMEIIREQMAIPSALLENVAWRIATAIHGSLRRVRSATVEIAKLAPPVQSVSIGAASVRLTI